MDFPVVSVLMTAYNRDQYISEAIESVLASSFKEFELIIVDDGSTDNTFSLAERYARSDNRIKLFKNERNLGDYHNRNKAASYASGKYLKYVDSDDIIYTHGLDIMVSAMEKYPEAALGVVSSLNQGEKPYPYLLQPLEAYTYNFFKKGIFDTGPTGSIIRTECFRQVGGFSGKRFIGDIELNLKLSARWPVAILNSSLVYWRIHGEQEYAIQQQDLHYLEIALPMLEAELYKKECPLSHDQVEIIIGNQRKIYSRHLVKMALNPKHLFDAYKISRHLSLGPGDFLKAFFWPKKSLKSQ